MCMIADKLVPSHCSQYGIVIQKSHERRFMAVYAANHTFNSWMSLRRASGVGISIFAFRLGQGRVE